MQHQILKGTRKKSETGKKLGAADRGMGKGKGNWKTKFPNPLPSSKEGGRLNPTRKKGGSSLKFKLIKRGLR